MDSKPILDKLRDWYEFSPRAITDVAGGPAEFERLMGSTGSRGRVLRIVVNDRVYYRRAKP